MACSYRPAHGFSSSLARRREPFLRSFLMKSLIATGLLNLVVVLASTPVLAAALEKPVDIEPVWAGHRVAFALLTHGDRQFAAYYDAERTMSVASRKLGELSWTIQKLDSKISWDSHNYIVLAIDRAGHLHVSGNMHVVPLVYFRSRSPLDVTTLECMPAMTGEAEKRVTYPRFIKAPDGALLFMYRDGASGNGRRLINRYDEETQSWSRYLDTPLLDGTAQDVNAYPNGFVKSPDGFFHLVWMWRETPDCRSNFHLSHARSRDLKTWETAGGKTVALPITPENLDVVVDPTPAFSGLINISFGIGFDAQSRPIIHYHNYDRSGKSQIYLARWEDDAWKIRQVSQWDHRWKFEGGGSINADLSAGAVKLQPDGMLGQNFSHVEAGAGVWIIDPETLHVVDTRPLTRQYPTALSRVEGRFPGLEVSWQSSEGDCPPDGSRYSLRWETLNANRDRPREGPLPEPSMLRVYHFEAP